MDKNKQPHYNGDSLCLPQFGKKNSEAWFGMVEARFHPRHIEDEQMKFDMAVMSFIF
jgi:hypothetical protein